MAMKPPVWRAAVFLHGARQTDQRVARSHADPRQFLLAGGTPRFSGCLYSVFCSPGWAASFQPAAFICLTPVHGLHVTTIEYNSFWAEGKPALSLRSGTFRLEPRFLPRQTCMFRLYPIWLLYHAVVSTLGFAHPTIAPPVPRSVRPVSDAGRSVAARTIQSRVTARTDPCRPFSIGRIPSGPVTLRRAPPQPACHNLMSTRYIDTAIITS